MKRTVTDAANALEDMARGLNPVAYQDLEREVDHAPKEATKFANGVAADLASEVTDARTEVLQELCDIRDAFAALNQRGHAGVITAGDYHDEWDALAGRQRAAERRVAKFAERAETLQAIEDDPVAYADRFYANAPTLMPDFTF